MAANVNPIQVPQVRRVVATTDVPFIDQHFAKLAFAVATAVLVIFSSFYLFLGAAAGLALHHSIEPNLKVDGESEIVTISNTTVAIVGAFAALLKIFPAGAAGGLVFQSIPLIASFAVGSTIYRAFRCC